MAKCSKNEKEKKKEENPLNFDSASGSILMTVPATCVCRAGPSEVSDIWSSVHIFNSVMAAPSPPAFQADVQSLTSRTSSFHCIIALKFGSDSARQCPNFQC